MCGRKYSGERATGESIAAQRESYDGVTTRLSGAQAGYRSLAGFPWWILWMIWPLLILVKWFVPLVTGGLATLAGSWYALAAPVQLVGAIGLVLIGVALLRRRE